MSVGYGLVPGYRRVAALGNNPDVDAGAPEDVWTGGGLYPWMTAATSLEILSASAVDAAAGTGARTVLINALDINHVEVPLTLTLNGVTPVALPQQIYRINSALVMTAGSGEVNAGDITIRDLGGGTVRAIIPTGYGVTRQSMFTTPAGHTLQVTSNLFCFNRASAGARFATFATFFRSPAGVRRLPLEITIGDEPPYRHDGLPGLIVPEKNDFALRCTFASNNDSDVTAAWLGVLRNNTVAVA